MVVNYLQHVVETTVAATAFQQAEVLLDPQTPEAQANEDRAERATNLKFKRDVAVELRSRAQVRDYVIHKFDQDVPAAELHGAEAAYKLFGLIPDSLDLRRTMIDLLTEQVAGYYDPDSGALFIPTDQPDPFKVRVVASHELIHALQDQYLPLDSILNQQRSGLYVNAGIVPIPGDSLTDREKLLNEMIADTVVLWPDNQIVSATGVALRFELGLPFI